MEKSIKCPGCGQEYQEQMAQCACGWDFTEDFVLYPSVSRIPEESEQFHIVEDAYIKKIQEIMGRVEAAYQASLNESKELSRIAQDLEEAENLIKTIIRRDGSDENFEWFGKIYMQKTLIQGKLQRQSSTEIKRNLSGNRKNLDNEEQDKFLRIYREAEEGSRDAQFAVGYMYEQGEGTEIDYNEAAKYYSMAAQKGHEGAQHNLAVLYYTGRGVKQDSPVNQKKDDSQGCLCVTENSVYFLRLHSQKHPNAGICTPLASSSRPEIRSVYMPSSSLIHATLSNSLKL